MQLSFPGLCFSFDEEGKLSIMATDTFVCLRLENTLDSLKKLEHHLTKTEVEFETTKGEYHMGGETTLKTNAIIIDLALPGFVKKFIEPKADQGG